MKIFYWIIVGLFLILNNYGIAQPLISVSPGSLNVSLGCQDSITQNLTINNTGTTALAYSTFFKYAYLCNYNDQSVSVLDITTNTIVGSPINIGESPMRAVISPDANHVYVSSRDGNSVYVIQTSSNTVVDTVTVGSGPMGLAFTPNGNFLYVTNQYGNFISIIDCNTNTVVNEIYDAGFNNPTDIGITADGKFAYVSNRNNGVTVIETTTNTVIQQITGISVAHSITFSQDGQYVFVTESVFGGGVVQIGIASNTIIRKIGTFDQAVGIDITPDGKYLYAVDKWNDYIQIIEVSSGSVIDTIADPLFDNGWGLAISPDGRYAYVGISWSDPGVIILDLVTRTIIGNINTNTGGTWGIATLNNVPAWITSGITSDTIQAGNSSNVSLEFNSTNLPAGNYLFNLTVFSNDLVTPQVEVPCVMQVAGNPEMILSDTCLYFDTTYVTGNSIKPLKIYNLGCDTLKITGLIPTAQFNVPVNTLNISPYDSAELNVSFLPVAAGLVNGLLSINSNDYNTTICLKGVGKLPPNISVSPMSLSATAYGCVGDTITQLLTINNTGFDNLNCNINMEYGFFDSTSYKQYYTSGATTLHVFPVSVYPDSIHVTVTINGDLDSDFEYVDVYIEGTFIETIPDGNLLETDIIRNYTFGGTQLSDWLLDNQIAVTLINSGNVDAFGSTDYHKVQLSYNGISWPGMLNPVPSQVIIPPSGSQVISVNFFSTGLNAGVYDTYLFIESNDPDTPVDSIPCTLTVVGDPEITVLDTCLNFPSLLLGLSATDTIIVNNTGCDTLFLNSINATPGAFSFSSLSFPVVVQPGNSFILPVTFTPTVSQVYAGNLSIISNAGNKNICLNGTGLPAASINLIPDTISVSLVGCNDSIVVPLGIYNSGGADLNYSIDVSGAIGASAVQPPTGYCIPTYGSLCSSADYINNFTFNTLSKLNSGCNGAANNFILDQSVTTQVTPGSTYSISMQAGSAYNQGFGVWIDYNRDGDFADAGEFVYASPGASTILYTGSVTIPVNASLGRTRLRVRCAYSTTVNSAAYCANFSYGETEDYIITIGQPFVTCSPSSGTSLVGETTYTNVKVKSYGLASGTYVGTVIVNSNDPANPTVSLPCTLNVVGVPNIVPSASTVSFDSIFQYATKTDSVIINNTSCGYLNITNITNANPAFSVDSTTLVINPWSAKKLRITFHPTAVGIHRDTLNIFNNDSNIKVSLYGYALSPPVISYSPGVFTVTTSNCNDTIILPLTINNTGDTDLIVSLSGGAASGYNLDVAIAGSEDAAYVNDVRNKLLATGKFNTVTIVDVRYSTPTLATLQQYDAILVWMDYSYNNPTLLGNVLADYVDNGGAVVSGIFETGYSGHMLGRWDTQQYYVITRGSYVSGYTSLGTVFDPSHPIMQNIASLNGYNGTYRPSSTTLTPTSMLIANWADGKPLVAVKEKNGNRIVDLGLWPPSSDVGAESWSSSTDGDLLMANALEWASGFVNWLSVSDNYDTIPSGGSSVINVTFNTSDLITGNYSASIIINSNDPLNPLDTILCNITLDGHPSIIVSDTCVNFNTVMQWTSKTDTVIISNTGCDTLFVSDITFASSVFTANLSTLTILPDDEANVLVTFSPLTVGLFSDTMKIFNNDGLVKVCLNGSSFSPPVLSYFPDSIVATVNICNDSVTLPLSIFNPGDTNLNWSTVVQNNIPKSSINLNTGFSYVSVPNYTGLPTGSVMTAEAWIYPVSLPDASYNGIVAFGPRVCTGTSFLLSMTAAGRPSFASWCKDFVPSTGPTATLNQWHHVAAVLNGSTIKLYLDGYEWTSSLGTAPNVQANTLTIGCTDNPGRYFTGRIDEVRVWNQARTPQQLENFKNRPLDPNMPGLVSYWNFDEGSGNSITDLTGNGHTGFFINEGWSATGAPLSNISLSTYSGTIPAGDTTVVNVTFYTDALIAGTYYENIILNSNDPLNTADTVSCVLHYNGYPEVAVSQNCFDFDSLFQFASASDTLWISNNGCAPLNITGITNTLSAFTTNFTPASILPGDSASVAISFNPVTVGHFYDTLFVVNNDSTLKICLHGYALSPPVISTNPVSFNETLTCCDSTLKTLTIHNTGDYNLIYNVNTNHYYSTYDGVDDYIRVNNTYTGLNTVTVEAWIYPTNTTGLHYIVSNARDCCTPAGGFSLLLNGTSLNGHIWRSSGSALISVGSPAGSISLNTWQHVAMVYDGTKIQLFKNGELIATSAVYASSAILNSSINLHFGVLGYSAPTYYDYKGYIDNIRIWNVPKSQNQIYSQMYSNLNGSEAGLRGCWNFENQTANDISPYGNNGTRLGNCAIASYPPNSISNTIAEWLTVNSLSDTIIPGDSSMITLKFKSCGLLVGNYTTDITISSNDPVNPVDTISCVLTVTGSPVISTSQNCILFDSISQYTNISEPLWIHNTGCDTLFVTDITNSTSQYSLDTTSFFVIPGDSSIVTITYSPTIFGLTYDTLHIINNASPLNICLQGYAYKPPVISFLPDTFDVTLSCNDSVTLPLMITNTGDTTLYLSISDFGCTTPAVFSDNFEDGNYSGWISGTCSYSNTVTTVNPAQGTRSLSLSGGGCSTHYTGLKYNFGTCTPPVISFWAKPTVTNLAHGYFVIGQNPTSTASQMAFFYFKSDGQMGVAGPNVFVPYTANQWYHVEFKNINYTARTYDFYINNNLISTAVAFRGTNTTINEVHLYNYDNTTSYYDDILIGNCVGQNWMTVNPPLTDTIAPGDTVYYNVDFNSTLLNLGQYTAPIVITSNDPVNGTVSVPCILNVVGVPDISMSDTCLHFDTIMQWQHSFDTLIISNTGCDTLKISNIFSALTEFVPGFTSQNIAPGNSASLIVSFNPTTIDTFSGNLTIVTNIGSYTVCLNAVSTPPPVISVNPVSMNVTVTACNDSAVFPFKIYNTGNEVLIFTSGITSVAASLSSSGGNIVPDDSTVINLIINGTSVAPGVYNVPIVINSNDPLHPIDSIPVTFTITPRPLKPLASDTSICKGSIVPSLFAVGSNIQWYRDTGLVYTGNTFASGDTAVGIYYYYVTQTIDSCESIADTVTLAIYAIPGAPTGADNVICFENPDASLTAIGSNITWFDDGNLTTQVATGNIFNTGLSAVGSYTYYLTQTINNCQSPSDTLVLTINPIPSAPVVSDTTICSGNPTPDLITSGENIQWFSDSTLLNLIYAGNILSPGVTNAGVYTYYVTQTNILYNCQGHATVVTLTIDSLQFPPVAADNIICFGQTTPAFTATGDSIHWYANSSLTTLVGLGNTFTPTDVAVGSYTYYLTQNTLCGQSSYDSTILVINPIPSAPSAVDQSVCFGYPVPDIFATGTNINWYSDSLLANNLDTGNVYTTGLTAVGSYTFFLTQTLNNCESPFDSVTLEIRPTPVIPTVSDTAICFGNPTPDLISTGNNVQWYDDATLTSLVNTGNIFSSGNTASGVYVYYVTDLDVLVGCESFSDTVILTINAIPSAPVANDTAICFEQNSPGIPATGVNIQWYFNTSVINTGNTFTPSETVVGNYDYFVSQTINNCESPFDTITFTINPLPAVPVVSDTVVCAGAPVPNIIAQGTNIRWYSDSLLLNLVYSGDTLISGVSNAGVYTWYVTQTIGLTGCEGPYKTVSLTIDSLLPEPVVNDISICFGTITPAFTTSGTGVHWYSDAALINNVEIGNTYTSPETAVGTYVYFINQNNNCGGGSADSAILTIKAIPLSPDATGNSVCFGQPNQIVTAIGSNITWYQDSLQTVVLNTTDTYTPAVLVPGTYIYYVSQTVNLCESPTDTVIYEVHSLPVPPLANDTSTCTVVIPPLIAVGSNILWYDSIGNVFAGDTLNTGLTQYGVFEYYATQTNSATGCESNRDTVLLTIATTILVPPVVNDTASCYGQSVPDLIAQGLDLSWFADSSLITLVNTGNVFSTGNSNSGTYTYWVVQENICGFSPKDSITLTIHDLPASPVSQDTSTCFGTTLVLSATGNNVSWYQDSNLNTFLYNGNNFTPSASAPSAYVYYLTDSSSVTGCISNLDSVIFIIKDVPVAPVAENQTVCSGGNVPDLSATGINVNWYSDSLLTNLVYTGNVYSTGQTNAGVYTYYLVQSNECGSSLVDSVSLIIGVQPGIPTTSDETACYGSPNPSLLVGGSNINWYADTALTQLVFTGNSYTPVQINIGTYTWYVTETIIQTGCVSNYASVSLTITDIPVAPVAADTSVCAGNPNPTLFATGSNIIWYSDTSLATVIQNGTQHTPTETAAGNYYYYITQTVNNCQSPYSSVLFVVKALPPAPVTLDYTICDGENIPLLTSVGSNLTWYSDSLLTNIVATDSIYQPVVNQPGTYNWYVTQSQNNCEGPYDAATLSINALPLAPVASNDTICYGGIVPTLTAIGSNIVWYGDLAQTIVLQNGNNYQPSDTSVGVHHFYVTQNDGICESSANDVSFVVFDASVAPVANDNTVCEGSGSYMLTASGVNIHWYSDSLLTNLVQIGNTLFTNDSLPGTYVYYVTQTVAQCGISNSDIATLTINAIPQAPEANDVIVCYGTPVPDLVATGNNLTWFSEPEQIILINVGSTFSTGNSAVGTYAYYVTQTVNGCPSAANEVVLTINPTPLVTLNTYHANINEGESVTLIAYNASSYTWSPITGLNVATGPVVIASPLQTTTYVVTGTSSQGCIDTAKCTVEVGQIGVDENSFAQSLSVFPNPTNKFLNVKFATLQKEPICIKIVDQLGRVIIITESNSMKGIFEETISLEGIADGVYNLQILTTNSVLTKKIVLKR